jgi:hypothetical protein
VNIRDARVRQEGDRALDRDPWPEPWLSLNPKLEPGVTISDLIAAGVLHQECDRIFRLKTEKGLVGPDLNLPTPGHCDRSGQRSQVTPTCFHRAQGAESPSPTSFPSSTTSFVRGPARASRPSSLPMNAPRQVSLATQKRAQPVITSAARNARRVREARSCPQTPRREFVWMSCHTRATRSGTRWLFRANEVYCE